MKKLGCKMEVEDWDLEPVASFLHLLDAHIPNREGADQVRWRLKRNGKFSVRSFYSVLWSSITVLFPWKGIFVERGGVLLPSCLEMLHINLIVKTTLNDTNDLSMCPV